MSEQLEQWVARLENKQDQLRMEFHLHAEQPVHTGFVDGIDEIRADLRALQARWLTVSGAVIGLLIAILLSLLGVVWTLTRPVAAVPAAPVTTVRMICSQFPSQASAQAYYRANPAVGVVLDGDRDGLACEDNPAPNDWLPVTNP